jgi:hypothetical protein
MNDFFGGLIIFDETVKSAPADISRRELVSGGDDIKWISNFHDAIIF